MTVIFVTAHDKIVVMMVKKTAIRKRRTLMSELISNREQQSVKHRTCANFKTILSGSS